MLLFYQIPRVGLLYLQDITPIFTYPFSKSILFKVIQTNNLQNFEKKEKLPCIGIFSTDWNEYNEIKPRLLNILDKTTVS